MKRPAPSSSRVAAPAAKAAPVARNRVLETPLSEADKRYLVAIFYEEMVADGWGIVCHRARAKDEDDEFACIPPGASGKRWAREDILSTTEALQELAAWAVTPAPDDSGSDGSDTDTS